MAFVLRQGRLWWKVAAALAALGLLVAGGLYWAVHHEPKFYREALVADPEEQRVASDQMLQHAANLASDITHTGTWQAVFTAQQINGWLAVDLPQNHGDLLPPDLQEPRVRIEAERLLIGCRLRNPRLNTVVSLVLEPYVVRPNTLAIRVRAARIGGLPMPLRSMLDAVAEQLNQAQFHVEWRQADADPVAIITLPPMNKQKPMQIESLRLTDGKLTVGGTTQRRPPQ